MTEMIPNLWFGSRNTVSIIEKKNIDIVINCSNDCKKFQQESLDFYFDEHNLVKENFNIILDYIHKNLKNDKSVYVYCRDGKEQSAMLILLYIIKYGKVNKNIAIKYFQTKISYYFDIKNEYDLFLRIYFKNI